MCTSKKFAFFVFNAILWIIYKKGRYKNMKVIGIIAEYNPFHKGHEYQIKRLREMTGADYVIIAMSGNFLQRGVPALCDKYTRTEMALHCGADLVLELPVLWATASAEYFAQGGVQLLASTGVVTHLGFGAETEDLKGLLQVSSILKNEPDVYRAVLVNSIRSGNPFPVARKNALITSLPMFSSEKLDEILDSPNNILALEYLKALPKQITPILIPRKGADYHSTDIHETFPSATAIRETLFGAEDTIAMSLIENAMPTDAYAVLQNFLTEYRCMDIDDFSSMLGYRLLSLSETEYSTFADCSKDFSNKVKNHLNDYVTFSDFIQQLKSKDMTYTRISRSLLHILLNITQAHYQIGQAMGYTSYLRVLGFKKESSKLLSAIKANSNVPMITKVADASTILGYEPYKMFQMDLFASALYCQCLAQKSGKKEKPLNDFTHPMVILSS